MAEPSAHPLAAPPGPRPAPAASEATGSLLSTVSGPAWPSADAPGDADDLSAELASASPALRRLALQKAGLQRLADALPFNALKALESGLDNGHAPMQGVHVEQSLDDEVSASTITEDLDSNKLGDGRPHLGHNPLDGPLDRVRVDSQRRALTTNQGVTLSDNQHALKAGLRGPTLLEDFILREKLTHFGHERIPERVVHARGAGAHGHFEAYESLAELTMADPFSQAGQRTPVFVRFSTVAGERGSADTVRDTRGFAVKFYTRAGNWDLVGNNMPVFFIQDAMKFPDLVHAVKPEPHHGMPQASSAHDTFWDFVSLMPESIHHTLWVMSDRGIPRSYRTMQGFGVHTFRLVNAQGAAHFVKFHWLPLAGTHSLVWDEAVRIAGADPDFHRRDLWEAIEAGHPVEYELALQVFTDEQAAQFSFDVLDPTKLVPEELVPLRAVGRLVLDRNPDNFFAETEQVAFCAAHLVPGIDFSNDPLLQGRLHSYLDTQLTRLGGPNFHEIPINAPLAAVHNNQRDGLHRQAIHRGRVGYEPNSLAGGCPYQGGAAGFRSLPEPVFEDKVRGKPEKFADHFSQAQLFWRSQSVAETRHIVDALRFELTRVTVPAVRTRVVSLLLGVDLTLARGVAEGLGIELPAAQPLGWSAQPPPRTAQLPAGPKPVHSEVDISPALSLLARPGQAQATGRRVALLVLPGADGATLRHAHQRLLQALAVPRFVGLRLGRVAVVGGAPIEIEASLEALPSVLWDGLVLPDGDGVLPLLAARSEAVCFVIDQYRHGKPILALGTAGRQALTAAGVPLALVDEQPDRGLVLSEGHAGDALSEFIAALGAHRQHERERAPWV